MTIDENHKRGRDNAIPTIGQRLREVRGGMSQAEFAQILNMSQSSIANYETGKRVPDASLILDLMSAFGVDPVWLISGESQRLAPSGGSSFSKEELRLIESYRKSGEQQNLLQAIADVFANFGKGKR